MCVQNFDDSLNSAIRITYRISLRSSSLREPRYPLLKVVFGLIDVSNRRVRVNGRLCFVGSTCAHSAQSGWGRVNMQIWGYAPAQPLVRADTTAHWGVGDYVSQSGLITDRIGVVMILPQVHLRKPCYDLFFL